MVPAGKNPTQDNRPAKTGRSKNLPGEVRWMPTAFRAFNPKKLNGRRSPARPLGRASTPPANEGLLFKREPGMSRVFQALTAEPWAIDPSWLPLMAAIAQRNFGAPEVAAAQGWQARDHDLMAGPGAQKLAGSQRAYLVEGVAIIPITGPIFPRANMMTEMSGATSITMLLNDYRAR
jgi:hypothetical protein